MQTHAWQLAAPPQQASCCTRAIAGHVITANDTMLFESAKLELAIAPSLVFVHPKPPLPTDHIVAPGSGDDSLVQGQATLTLPRARDLKDGITICFVVHVELYLPGGPVDKGIVFERKVHITPGHLDKGVHTLPFQFSIPSSVPSYILRSRHGKVTPKIIAVAGGLGSLGADLTTEIFCPTVPNPSGVAELPPGLSLDVIEDSDELGPYSINVTSDHMTLSGLMLISLNLLAPSTDFTLSSISLIVEQTFELTPLRYFTWGAPLNEHQADKLVRPETVIRRVIAHIDGNASPHDPPIVVLGDSPGGTPANLERSDSTHSSASDKQTPYKAHLAQIRKGEQYISPKFAVRLPCDESMSSSTFPGTHTPLRFSHSLLIEIRWINPQGRARLLKVRKPIMLASCCCVLESLVLPTYAQSLRDKQTDIEYQRQRRDLACVCGFSFQYMLDQESRWIERELEEAHKLSPEALPKGTT
ncbi:uncharacterized protein L969DRAFT_94732 [Mixia osmundae IAM 14324]|uniref:Arrestin-like N-terminal domain-containing protein n=1 Tax=Mixia osmundae (strain CBS 9802 / IAM 14324 / JCM 22182 / KY 12970) TaxID=764103 RepID=G7E430_MIXOS|nr:uncharacterized protein L969DRAFT_94732 [Mixia osmundae IAM 14324]KEI39684.1 hypothetical protein L969DRAFT_94732 [Mixia osmundae IAM 14324]GAA97590.1 hypothetical protein E5Q_04268 [Mixia osmundae IAM 14324]